jgi:hypothetical protein
MINSAARIIYWFRETGNVPATPEQISDGAAVPIETVEALLFKRNRGRFVKDRVYLGVTWWKLSNKTEEKQ